MLDFDTKKRRLAEVVELQRSHMAFIRTKQFINQTVEILIEKESKKSSAEWSGRSASKHRSCISKRSPIKSVIL